MFSIDEFNANVNRSGGIGQKNQFLAVILPPAGLDASDIGVSTDHFSFRMDTFEYPSRSVVPLEYTDYGPVRQIGGMANFVDVTGSVIMSSDFREREFFMRWQDMIVGNHRNESLESDQIGRRFDVGYFNDYRSSGVEIRQYNQTSQSVDDYTYRVGLVDVFPQLVGSMDTSWESDDPQRMSVTFAYRYFVEDFNVLPGMEGVPLDSLFNRAFRTFSNLHFLIRR